VAKANIGRHAAILLIVIGAAIPEVAARTRQGAAPPPSREVEASRNVETLRLTSKVFGNTRALRVLLPPGYHDPRNAGRRYPVFYFNDGIMVFNPRRVNIGEVVHRLIESGALPPLIVVGVDNGGSTDRAKDPARGRANEYLPYPDAGFGPHNYYAPDPPDPQGKLYPRFLVDEVMPLVGRRYRVKTGPSNTGVGGISYGGVAALYAALSRPGVFGALLLESTPLWIGSGRQLLEDARRAGRWPAAVYLGAGTNETADEAVNKAGLSDMETLASFIRRRSPATALKVVAEQGGRHEPAAWRARLPAALLFLLGRRAPRELPAPRRYTPVSSYSPPARPAVTSKTS
jgi:enterochelin esterase-like enzyme